MKNLIERCDAVKDKASKACDELFAVKEELKNWGFNEKDMPSIMKLQKELMALNSEATDLVDKVNGI